MENLIEQLEENKNCNGGGLAVNITGRYESNRHAIAKIEKVTFGDCVKFLKTKKGGSFAITANDLLDAYRLVKGEPEWHHAGFLPKSYGGGMKKTYFLDTIPTKEEVITWFVKASRLRVQRLFFQHRKNIMLEKQDEFLKLNATEFTRLLSTPNNYCVRTFWEMKGKYGWFESDPKYKLDEFVSGFSFDTKEKYDEYYYLTT